MFAICVAGASTFRFLKSCSVSLIGLIMLYAVCWLFSFTCNLSHSFQSEGDLFVLTSISS